MKSQFHALLLDALAAKRSGALSGIASPDATGAPSADSGNKSFSLIIRNGEVVGGDFADRHGAASILLLLNAPAIVKVRWFQMQNSSIAASEPLLPSRQLELLMAGTAPVATPDATRNPASDVQREPVKQRAVEVFQRLFADSADDRLQRILSGLGHTAKASEIAKACIATVSPLIGEDMARGYFQEFL